jgi:hypothetical protein
VKFWLASVSRLLVMYTTLPFIVPAGVHIIVFQIEQSAEYRAAVDGSDNAGRGRRARILIDYLDG